MKLNADYSISILAADERFMVTYDSNGSLTERRNYESNDDTFADIYEEMKQENLKCISRNNTVYFKDAHYNDISVYLRVTDGNLNLIKSSPQGMVEDKNNAVLYILFIAAFLIFITVLVIFILKEKIIKTKKAHKQADDVSCHHDFESNISNEKE